MAAVRWSIEDGMMIRRSGRGPEIVWIHGLGEQSATFDAIAYDLPDFQHVLVDLPGYGRSPWPDSLPPGDTVAWFAERLARWIGDRAPILAGHSMGGVIAQMVAEQVPVAAVVDVDGNLSLGDCTFSLQAIEYAETDFVSHGFTALREARYERGVADTALRGHYAGMRLACPLIVHRNCRDLVELSRAETLAPRLAALATPTLFVAGVPGGICPRSHELLAEHGIHHACIPGSGHWPFIDQPAAFADVVRSFLAG